MSTLVSARRNTHILRRAAVSASHHAKQVNTPSRAKGLKMRDSRSEYT
jgi:hypothetical protein